MNVITIIGHRGCHVCLLNVMKPKKMGSCSSEIFVFFYWIKFCIKYLLSKIKSIDWAERWLSF